MVLSGASKGSSKDIVMISDGFEGWRKASIVLLGKRKSVLTKLSSLSVSKSKFSSEAYAASTAITSGTIYSAWCTS